MTLALATVSPASPFSGATAAPSPQRPPGTPAALGASELLPALRDQSQHGASRLSDDGFSDSLVSIPLSRHLSLALVTETGGKVRHVSYRALDDLHLSARQAWDIAAANLQRRALTPAGLQFWTRPAAAQIPGCPGLEVRARGGDISAWLAHPQNFSILDAHLRRLSRCDRLVYLVPDTARLFVLGNATAASARSWASRAFAAHPAHRPVLSRRPLVWAHGFPQEL